MKQVVVIHGGDSFATYEEYLAFLRAFPIELEGSRGWKSGLEEALGPGYQVIMPRMPNPQNARFLEWSIWFEKYLPLVEDDVLLVGHSLGGSFLAKYLAEKDVEKRIRGTFLVAAPYDDVEGGYEFLITGAPDRLARQGGEIFLYHSEDDPIVPYVEFEKYRKALPEAHARTFSDRGHFIGPEFPEIAEDIRSLG